MVDFPKIDGFHFFPHLKGRNFLLMESGKRLEACVDYCNRNRIAWVWISRYHGYAGKNLDFLAQCPSVKGVGLQDAYPDMSGIYRLPRLRMLSAGFDHRLTLSRFKHLEELRTEWSPKIHAELLLCVNLKYLSCRKFKSKTGDLSELERLSKLREADFSLSTIQSLDGIEHFKKLKRLEVNVCSRLREIEPVTKLAATLEEFRCDNCKNVDDKLSVTALKRLKNLTFNDDGELPSLKFLRCRRWSLLRSWEPRFSTAI